MQATKQVSIKVEMLNFHFCNISNGIARVIFYVEDNTMVLLHAFIKKTQETPKKELDVAIKRYKELLRKS